MARDDGAGAGTVLLAFLVGAIGGAAVALLYAPTSGRETREYLGERAREGRVMANEMADCGREAMKQGKDVLKQSKETLATAIDRGREAYKQARTGEGA